MDVQDECLAHHGVLGMKWGIRRYRNYDGSLTAAGQKHINSFKNSKQAKRLYSKTEKVLATKQPKLDNFRNSKKQSMSRNKAKNLPSTKQGKKMLNKANSMLDGYVKKQGYKSLEDASHKAVEKYGKKKCEEMLQEQAMFMWMMDTM